MHNYYSKRIIYYIRLLILSKTVQDGSNAEKNKHKNLHKLHLISSLKHFSFQRVYLIQTYSILVKRNSIF